MPSFRIGEVVRVVRTHADGVQDIEVDVEGEVRSAVLYPRYAAPASPGDHVVVNTTAVDLGLGTGDADFVVWNLAAREHHTSSGGHIMKLRYTPAQSDVLSVEAPESPHHDAMSEASDLGGTTVVAASLHSQLMPVVAGIRSAAPDARIAYVMTDGGALEAGLSRTLRRLRELGWIHTTVTAGHAIGGDLEAVTVHSALLAARVVVGADVVVAGMGPGVVGTSTPFGTTGVDVGLLCNASVALGGRTVAAVRMSEADPRQRHRGLSHHARRALGRLVLRPESVEVPVPEDAAEEVADALTRFRVVAVDDSGWDEHLRAAQAEGVEASHMGRGPRDDPLFFRCAFTAGCHAAAG